MESKNPTDHSPVLETMSANSYNFIVADLLSGNHTVEVQAMVSSDSSAQNGSASASATTGYGSVTVEEVRMIMGEDVVLE